MVALAIVGGRRCGCKVGAMRNLAGAALTHLIALSVCAAGRVKSCCRQSSSGEIAETRNASIAIAHNR
jgi:hypothetical protein